jgi:hypothetical protein
VDSEEMRHLLPCGSIWKILEANPTLFTFMFCDHRLKETIEDFVVVFSIECTLGITNKGTELGILRKMVSKELSK